VLCLSVRLGAPGPGGPNAALRVVTFIALSPGHPACAARRTVPVTAARALAESSLVTGPRSGFRTASNLLLSLKLEHSAGARQSSLYSLPLAPANARPGQPLAHRHGPAVVSDGAAAGSRSPTGPAARLGPITP
jgi:hypothetical protein